MNISRINIIFFPSLSILFIICVLAIGINVSKYQKSINDEAYALTILSGIRNDLSNYLENPRNIDKIEKRKWFVDFQNEAVKDCITEKDWQSLSMFLAEFNYNTPKRKVLGKVNQINFMILEIRVAILKEKDTLFVHWTWIIVLGILACLFALLSSFLVIVNRKQNENLQQKNKELKNAKDEAEAANIAKSEFLNVMSHEIRTPLNGVIGLSHILAHSNPTTEQKRHIELLQFSSENLLGLVNDILDFGKIEAGKVQLEEQSFEFGNHLRKIISTLEPYARSKNLSLFLEVHNEFKNNVLGDSARLGQIIFNLVNNAIKFTSSGSVQVKLLLINESEIDITVKVSIKDTGIGISDSQRKQIFDKFSQASANTTRKYGGSGLGLSISQKLLEIMGSGLFLESSPEKGSHFWFQITLPKSINAVELDVLPNTPELNIGEGKKVLIVEDNKINLLIIERYLSDFNINFESAENGKEALELVNKSHFDLILMDLQMPIMDGYTASQKIKELKGNSKPKILAISAANQSKNKAELLKCGIEGFITKPIDIVELKRKLSLYL